MVKAKVYSLEGKTAEVEILVDGGPLFVGPAYSFAKGVRDKDLYFVYVKKIGKRVGPFYADITLAAEGMKKASAIGAHVWKNDATWYEANAVWLVKWVETNMGKANDLVGGQWVDEKGEPIKEKS